MTSDGDRAETGSPRRDYVFAVCKLRPVWVRGMFADVDWPRWWTERDRLRSKPGPVHGELGPWPVRVQGQFVAASADLD